MGKYVMKQDWWCLGDDYTIRDAAGEDVMLGLDVASTEFFENGKYNLV